MKTILQLTSCVVMLSSVYTAKSQWVSIPDTNFGKWLNTNGYSQCLQGNSMVGWEMDTTCNAVTTAQYMYCYNNGIKNLEGVQYFSGLKELYCYGNNLSFLVLPNQIEKLSCSHNQLTRIDGLPNSLQEIFCNNNLIDSIYQLPPNISLLSVESNSLKYIHSLPDSLMSCYLGWNTGLNGLPNLPGSLRTLSVNNCSIASLPTLPGELEVLNTSVNTTLMSLTSLPPKLKALLCAFNNLTILPVLPDSLMRLVCNNNSLQELPALLHTILWELECSNNLIDSIPELPATITKLFCYNNSLQSLPVLPESILTINCSFNQLTSLPALPESLKSLWCYSNQLTSIPSLPDSLTYLYCYDNPNLTCLPFLKKIKNFAFNNTAINCLPNYPIGNTSSNPALHLMPLCDPFNSNGCAFFGNISGKIYEDTSGACIYTTGGIKNVNVNLYNSGLLVEQSTIQIGSGQYSFHVTHGVYTITLDTLLLMNTECPDSGYYTSIISPTDSFDVNLDFGLNCKPGFDVEAKSIATPTIFRPAIFTTLYIGAGDASNFYGAHCAAGVSGAVTVTLSGPVNFIGAAAGALTPAVSGNTLTYTIADFGAVDFFNAFNMVLQTDTFAQLGQQVCVNVSVTPTVGDNNPTNNVLSQCFTIVNSYDPNDKTAYPAGDIDTAQKELTYTIRFQNTGNAEAQHIYITDTLSQYIDESSFKLLGYSHQPQVHIVGKAVRFNFPHINLPDSFSNEPGSHGYVQYKVRLKENLPIGTTINNTAFIYFDFNAPVVTNTATNTISLSTGLSKTTGSHFDIHIYPNPNKGVFTIEVPNHALQDVLTITDITGRLVLQQKLQSTKTEVEVPNGCGVYVVRVGSVVQKLVVKE